jgi:hypothetical protein
MGYGLHYIGYPKVVRNIMIPIEYSWRICLMEVVQTSYIDEVNQEGWSYYMRYNYYGSQIAKRAHDGFTHSEKTHLRDPYELL